MPDVREVYDMVTKQKPSEPGALERQQRRQVRAARNQRLAAFFVAAALCVSAVALFIATQPDDSTMPAEEHTTAPAEAEAVGLASRFLSAFGRFDADAAMSSLADDDVVAGIVTIEGASARDALAMDLAMLEAMGYEQTVQGCDAAAAGTDTLVTCPYEFHALRSDEIGLGPYGGSTFTFTVRDGAIARVDMGLNFVGAFSSEMWEPFAAWVSETYPEDTEVMYVDPSLTDYALTERSIRLWDERSREYVSVALAGPIVTAERFMDARDAHDATGALSLIPDGGADVRLLVDNAPSARTSMWSHHLDLDQLALALEAERIYGARYEAVRCGPIEHPVYPAAAEANVECSFEYDSRLRRLSNLAPMETFAHLGVRDGRITFLSFPWLNASFPGNEPAEAWPFLEWVQAEHPDAGAPMQGGALFHTEGQEVVLNLTPEALDLLERYLDEYERSVTG